MVAKVFGLLAAALLAGAAVAFVASIVLVASFFVVFGLQLAGLQVFDPGPLIGSAAVCCGVATLCLCCSGVLALFWSRS